MISMFGSGASARKKVLAPGRLLPRSWQRPKKRAGCSVDPVGSVRQRLAAAVPRVLWLSAGYPSDGAVRWSKRAWFDIGEGERRLDRISRICAATA